MTERLTSISPGMPFPALVEAIRRQAQGAEDKNIRISPAGGIDPNLYIRVEVAAEEKEPTQLTGLEDMVGKTITGASLKRYPDEGWGGGKLLQITFADGSTINFNITGGIGGSSVEVTQVERAA